MYLIGWAVMLLTFSSTSGTFGANLSSTRITPSGVTRTATSPASCSSPSSTELGPQPLGAQALNGPLMTYRLSLTFSIRIGSGVSFCWDAACTVSTARTATKATASNARIGDLLDGRSEGLHDYGLQAPREHARSKGLMPNRAIG